MYNKLSLFLINILSFFKKFSIFKILIKPILVIIAIIMTLIDRYIIVFIKKALKTKKYLIFYFYRRFILNIFLELVCSIIFNNFYRLPLFREFVIGFFFLIKAISFIIQVMFLQGFKLFFYYFFFVFSKKKVISSVKFLLYMVTFLYITKVLSYLYFLVFKIAFRKSFAWVGDFIFEIIDKNSIQNYSPYVYQVLTEGFLKCNYFVFFLYIFVIAPLVLLFIFNDQLIYFKKHTRGWINKFMLIMVLLNIISFSIFLYSLNIFEISDLFSLKEIRETGIVNSRTTIAIENMYLRTVNKDWFIFSLILGIINNLFFSILGFLKPFLFQNNEDIGDIKYKTKFYKIYIFFKFLINLIIIGFCFVWLHDFFVSVLPEYISYLKDIGKYPEFIKVLENITLFNEYLNSRDYGDFLNWGCDMFVRDHFFSLYERSMVKCIYMFFKYAYYKYVLCLNVYIKLEGWNEINWLALFSFKAPYILNFLNKLEWDEFDTFLVLEYCLIV